MDKVSSFEKFSYGIGCFGQNLIYGLMSSYLMIFYTDSFGLAAATVGTLFLIARIWDAVMDPIIGVLVDRVNTKWGKFRPFILIGGVLAGILTMLCFFNPRLGITGKIIYAYVTYIIWGTAYGIMDVPYWSMAPTMSLDPDERTSIISIPRIAAIIGMLLVVVLTIPMVQFFGAGNISKGYFLTAVIFGTACGICAILTFINSKERITIASVKKDEKFIDSVNVIAKNKPLIILLISMMFINIALTLKNTTLTYYFIYDIKNKDLIPIFSLISAVFMLIAMGLVAKVSKKIGKKSTFIGSCATSAIFNFIMYFYMNNIILIFILNALSMIGIGASLVLITSMEADTIEYAEWKTGKRSESIIFSLGTFTTKLSSALGGALLGYYLTLAGYVPNKVQSLNSVKGINFMMTMAPAIGLVFTVAVIYFYDLTEKRHSEILIEIEKSKCEKYNM